MGRLSEQEQQEIIRYLEAGKSLPEKYRFLLFEDKREVELVWNGKSNEIANVVLPFQIIEQVDEPRAENPSETQLQGELDIDPRGRQLKGWTNKLIWGDNKLILSSLKNGPMRQEIEEQGGLKLIYIDPPFDVGANFSMDIEIGEDSFTKKPNILEEIAYRDTWGDGTDSFLAMIYERLLLMCDLLADGGSIYVHCDWHLSGHMRLVMDEVFGRENFRNEIIWQRDSQIRGAKRTSKQFPRVHDTLLFYSKDRQWNFSQPYKELTDKQISAYRYTEKNTGRKYRTSDLGYYTEESIKRLESEGLIHISSTGVKSKKYYLDEAKAVVGDIWTDIFGFNVISQSKEKTGYPTQKPTNLCERIITTSSNEGDLIADFFCGSGTTAAVAEKLGRKWIAGDLGKFGIHTTRKRLIDTQRALKKEGKDYRAFEVLNLGQYERQHYVGINPNLREEEQQQRLEAKEAKFLDLILRAYQAEKIDGFEFFHGKRSGRMVVVGPINLPVSRLLIEDIIRQCQRKHITKVDILGFEFEMGLFPNMLNEAREKGIDIAPKNIPAEVFDKRAVEKNQVVFHDVAYIEVKPHVKGNTLAIELTDFSVFYSQDSVEQAAASLKNKSSKVVAQAGDIIRVSKDKDGVVSHEILNKKWQDWIDYWSVDFDFESKKEIIRIQKHDTKEWQEKWTGEYVFENEWQSFRTKKNRSIELVSTPHECPPGRRKIAVKVIDIFGNDTMTIIEVKI